MVINPSPRLTWLLVLLHEMAAFAIFAAVMPLPARLAMIMLVLLSLSYYLARDALLLFPYSWREFSFDRGYVSVVTRDGSGYSGQLTGQTTINSYFAVLSVKLEGRRLPNFRIIFPDALGAGEFRELCVFLKFASNLRGAGW